MSFDLLYRFVGQFSNTITTGPASGVSFPGVTKHIPIARFRSCTFITQKSPYYWSLINPLHIFL